MAFRKVGYRSPETRMRICGEFRSIKMTSLSFQAYLPVLASTLIAKACRLGKAVKIAFTRLPLAIKRRQCFFETCGAKPVRVPVLLRRAVAPCFLASYTLVHHKQFLVSKVS